MLAVERSRSWASGSRTAGSATEAMSKVRVLNGRIGAAIVDIGLPDRRGDALRRRAARDVSRACRSWSRAAIRRPACARASATIATLGSSASPMMAKAWRPRWVRSGSPRRGRPERAQQAERTEAMNPILWQPSAGTAAATQIAELARARGFAGKDAIRRLRQWSVDHPADFWQAVWELGGIKASRPADAVLLDGDRMPGARWFEGARLNFAENLLRRDDASPALIFAGEDGRRRELSWAGLQTRGARASPPRSRRTASASATGSRAICRTSPRRSSRCSRPRRWARSGRPPRPISASKACSTASARSSPRC